MSVYVASLVVDVCDTLEAFPVRVRLGSLAGKDVLVVLCPFWQFVVEKQNSRLGFLQQGRVIRNVRIELRAVDPG